MREIIAVCRSEKASRDRVARILDRYFWRIGDRTWRGKATNACLDRASRELRKKATRNTAVVIHEIRSSSESRIPIIRIGSRHAFSDEGVVPVSSHPADFRKMSNSGSSGAAIVGIAALFHDFGKATNLFQDKIKRALKGGPPEADAVRHELFSAALWDELFGCDEDPALIKHLLKVTAQDIDNALPAVRKTLKGLHTTPDSSLDFKFLKIPESMSNLIGLLILTHHRLPEGEKDHLTFLASRHVRSDSPLTIEKDLEIATGTPFWHEEWWLRALSKQANRLTTGKQSSADTSLRASLMLADHFGSSLKTAKTEISDHLANTILPAGETKFSPADSLSRHVKRVYKFSESSHDALHRYRDRYPALDASEVPIDVSMPAKSKNPRFSWQYESATAVRNMCESNEGGFFGVIMAGTGTGKTRGAPTILANAAMSDKVEERRYFRMMLGLGLRVLATQSAKEYVNDLNFSEQDVAVLIGNPPIEFKEENDDGIGHEGSESISKLPEWLHVENVSGKVPGYGSDKENQWIKGLSLNTDRSLPAFVERFFEKSEKNASHGRRLLEAPVLVGTIDHLMGVASPVNSKFLLQSIRLMTSDLILDEIDQYGGEDLAAIARLVFQAGAMGRRVIIMSATLTDDIASAFHLAYARGWSDYAQNKELRDHVNVLICGDSSGSVFTNQKGEKFDNLFKECRMNILKNLDHAEKLRRAGVLDKCNDWESLVEQIDKSISHLHDLNRVDINGYRVSVGMVKLTRISHTTAMACQIKSGMMGDRLRLMICLHSQMPRLHRSYIEARLKRSLTRKDKTDPNKGLRSLCLSESVFERANDEGVKDVEIVVVTTPVIETGNDLDFDWAILDPISVRSLIQAAGRVCRHRSPNGDHENTLILGRSPVAMQSGALSMPGIETRPSPQTGVPKIELREFKDRVFSELAGDADFSVINAKPILQEGLSFPLLEAETDQRRRMLSTDERDPLGRYLFYPIARWNLAMTKSRKFRRSDTREIEFMKIGGDLNSAKWFIDLAPGTRHSALREVRGELHEVNGIQHASLFENMTLAGWRELTGGIDDMEYWDIRKLLRVSIATFADDPEQCFTYSEFTGFTGGNPDDLLSPFGKSNSK